MCLGDVFWFWFWLFYKIIEEGGGGGRRGEVDLGWDWIWASMGKSVWFYIENLLTMEIKL